MKTIWAAVGVLLLAGMAAGSTEPERITQEELVRRTQELMDAVSNGDQKPFQKYFADDCMYFDEKGRNMDKTALVKDVTPLPNGYSGNIRVVHVQSRIPGHTAILSYDMDETEIIFGQELHARYRATDTWMWRDGKWQIVAGQVLRYYEDPAAGTADRELLEKAVGNYELAPGMKRTVSRDGEHLYMQRGTGQRDELIAETCGIFFRKGVEGRVLFHVNEAGRVDALIDRRNNEDVVWKKVN